MKRLYALLVLASVVLIYCKSKNNNDLENKTVFRYNEPGGITSLDPAFSRNLENIWAVNQIFNGLVQMSPSLKVQPCIAKRWEISEDGLEYTFYLRDDVYFHDDSVFAGGKGRRVTAQDFVYSFYRIIDEEVASPGAYIFNYLDKSEKSDFIGFKAVNDTIFKIFLKRPFPPFLSILTMQYCSVVPKEAVEFYKNDFGRHPVGTGPFKFKRWKEGVKLVLEKNPNYFEKDSAGNQLPYLDAVAVTFIKDQQISFLKFLKGELDFKSGLDPVFKDKILDVNGNLKEKYQNDFIMQKQPWLETVYLGVLVDIEKDIVKSSPLRIKAIRQAINYAFDREKMIKYLRSNIGRPATAGFIPYGMPGFDKDKVDGYFYNPEKSKELLLSAGFPNGEGMPEITLHTTKMYQEICEFIQHELTEIGMPVKIEVIDDAAFREMVAQGKVNFFSKSWVADYADAENFLALFYSKNYAPEGPNYTHFNNSEFDALYEKSMNEINDSARWEMYQKMDEIIMQESPVIPLYYNEVVHFVHKNIKGLETNPMNLLTLKKVRKISKE